MRRESRDNPSRGLVEKCEAAIGRIETRLAGANDAEAEAPAPVGGEEG